MNTEVKRSLIKVWLRVTKDIDQENRAMLLQKIDGFSSGEVDSLYAFYEESKNAENSRDAKSANNPHEEQGMKKNFSREDLVDFPVLESRVELEEEPHTMAPGITLIIKFLSLFVIIGVAFGGFAYITKRNENRYKDTVVAILCEVSILETTAEILKDPYSREAQAKGYEMAMDMERVIKKNGYDSVNDFEDASEKYDSDREMQIEVLRMAKDSCGYDLSTMQNYFMR